MIESRAREGRKVLSPDEIAQLFGLPRELRERLSEASMETPRSEDLESERLILVDSIRSLDQRLSEIGERKRELSREIESLAVLESSPRSLRREQEVRLLEIERAICESLGVEVEERERGAEAEASYQARGVFALGSLMALLGALILLPVEIPLNLKFVLGPGLILIGSTVLIRGAMRLTRARKR